ncbi:MAG: 3D domain-containing protein [Defluviitaleaceae bacterium]|nr:3D domain-containing protein [Defluviitaleaceae bacterium]
MKKFYHAMAGLVIVLALLITTVNAYEGTTRETNEGLMHDVTIRDGDGVISLPTAADTIAELLENMGITLYDRDIITPSIDNMITQGMNIRITRSIPAYVRIDGSEELIPFRARPGNILSVFVNEFSRYTESEFVFDSAGWHRRISAGDIVDVRSVRRMSVQDVHETPYGREYVDSDQVYLGETELYREGTPGRHLITTEIVHIGGRESSRTQVHEEVLAVPVSTIMHVGTAIPPNHATSACGEMFSYARTLIMEATAYTLSFECTGRRPGDPWFGITASGMQAQVGVVAVDTNVIPFHTRLYIEGYGFAVAGDRGGAIRGNKIDLFFDTRAEALQFGRQHIRVWILD